MLRKSFELNFYGHQRVAQAAVKIMLAQGTGGCLLFNVSKQAVNPGPNFGPYGLPKAATLFLVRQYALDYGADGIRANAVNADRIRSGLLTDDFIAGALKARGVSEKDYMRGNLLGREVTAEDVAQAFLRQALALEDHRRCHHRRRGILPRRCGGGGRDVAYFASLIARPGPQMMTSMDFMFRRIADDRHIEVDARSRRPFGADRRRGTYRAAHRQRTCARARDAGDDQSRWKLQH